jgi:hypothetical protein
LNKQTRITPNRVNSRITEQSRDSQFGKFDTVCGDRNLPPPTIFGIDMLACEAGIIMIESNKRLEETKRKFDGSGGVQPDANSFPIIS